MSLPSEDKGTSKLTTLQQLKAAKKAELKRKQAKAAAVCDVTTIASREDTPRGQVGLVYDERMLLHHCPWDPHHIETPDRLRVIWARCQELGLVERCERLEAREATDQELETYHTRSYLQRFSTGKNKSSDELESECREYDSVYMSPGTDSAARLATGSSIDLVTAVLDNKIHCGLGLVRPPGHHAMADTPCGFCGFNNIVIAAQAALARGVKKVLIVDFDLHHGQGTQYAFYSDPRVIYMSVHRYEWGRYWPHLKESDCDHIGEGLGSGFNVNVPLNTVGCGPADYLAVFHSVFLPVATEFSPELVLVSAGYDAAMGCPEGEMSLTPATYSHMVTSLASLASGRLVVLLEGGYCLPSLAESAALTLRALLGDPCPPVAGGEVKESVLESIRGCVTALKKYWSSLGVFTTRAGKDCYVPDLRFCPPDDWPPSEFPTRDYYLVYDEDTAKYWRSEVATVVNSTNLKCAEIKLGMIYDEAMMRHKNEYFDELDHPECPERIQRIFEALTKAGLVERKEVRLLDPGRRLTEDECSLVHNVHHWHNLIEIQAMTKEEREEKADSFNSIYLNNFSVDCGLLSAGAVLSSVEAVVRGEVRSSLAVVRPPGHHAEPDTPHGFCLFNNVAIAARYAINKLGVERVMILDWDVHHGNGIQHMFYEDSKVLYISLHRYDHGTFFPSSDDADYGKIGEGAGEGFNINIPWNKRKMGDSEYFLAFQNIVLPVGYEFQPELVLVSAGFDAAEGDPLGGYKVTPAMYGLMTHQLACLAQGRLVLALEGGYNLSSISACATQCAQALLGDPLPPVEITKPRDSALETIRNVVRVQRPHWKCLATLADKTLPETLETGIRDDVESLVTGLGDLNITQSPIRSVQRSKLLAQQNTTI